MAILRMWNKRDEGIYVTDHKNDVICANMISGRRLRGSKSPVSGYAIRCDSVILWWLGGEIWAVDASFEYYLFAISAGWILYFFDRGIFDVTFFSRVWCKGKAEDDLNAPLRYSVDGLPEGQKEPRGTSILGSRKKGLHLECGGETLGGGSELGACLMVLPALRFEKWKAGVWRFEAVGDVFVFPGSSTNEFCPSDIVCDKSK